MLAQEETAAGQTIRAGVGAGALTQLGPYKIDAKLGEGGMGEVFRATDTRLHRTVAIKMLRGQGSTDPAARERFQREARAASALNHPNICTVHDIGEADGQPYLVMECLEGETLRERLLRGKLPLPARALAYRAFFSPLIDEVAAGRNRLLGLSRPMDQKNQLERYLADSPSIDCRCFVFFIFEKLLAPSELSKL